MLSNLSEDEIFEDFLKSYTAEYERMSGQNLPAETLIAIETLKAAGYTIYPPV